MKARSYSRPAWVLLPLLALAARTWAVPPGASRPEAQGLLPTHGFIPSAGYHRTAKLLFLKRRVADQGLMMMAAPGERLDVHGKRAIPVILLSFKNVPPPYPAEDIRKLLFGDHAGSLTRYYLDASENQLEAAGQTLGWYHAPENDTVYEGVNAKGQSENGLGQSIKKLLTFGLESADADTDFGQFDNDGPDGLPNSGDDDGVVDTVFFVHPESGAESGGPTNIWSHSFHYKDFAPAAGPYLTNDIQKEPGGQPRLNADGTPKRIEVNDYTIQPALTKDNKLIQVGVFCHEYGHALGLPDFYDRTPRPPLSADSEGVGCYCLMAAGSYGSHDFKHSERPTELSAWAKYYLGWATPRVVSVSGPQELACAGEGNECLRLDVPNTQGLEYFLVEYRRNGPIQDSVNWDEFLPASGLAVWHVDESVGSASPTWPFAGPDQGQNDSPVKVVKLPPPLFRQSRPLVALIQFDRLMNLEGGLPPNPSKRNAGDSGDLLTTGVFGDDPTGIAGSRAYSGLPTHLGLKNVRFQGLLAQMDVIVADDPNAVLSAAPPPPSPPPGLADAAEEKTFLAGLEQRLTAQPQTTLSLQEAARVGQISTVTLEQTVELPEVASAILDKAREQLTREVGTATQVQTLVEGAAKTLSQAGETKGAVTLQLAPGGQHASFVSGLDLAPVAASVTGDAEKRLREDASLKCLLGVDDTATLQRREPAAPGDKATQQFQLVTEVDGQTLPVYSAKVNLHYDADNRLVAATSNLPAKPVHVTGSFTEETAAEIKQLAATHLGLPVEILSTPEAGVFLIDPQAGKGRSCYRLRVNTGENQAPIEVYVDAVSRKVLQIK